MAAPIKLNFRVYQGSTFKEVLRWETSTKVYKSITAITKSAPCVITAVGHSVPVGWRARITNVAGMVDINSTDTYHTITGSTTDTVTINALNSLAFKDYTSGGILEYNEPKDLSGLTAKMQIRPNLTSDTVILELTTSNGKIIIDNVLKTITINIPASDTELFDFTSAVYSLEIIDGAEVTPFITGTMTLEKEVTR